MGRNPLIRVLTPGALLLISGCAGFYTLNVGKDETGSSSAIPRPGDDVGSPVLATDASVDFPDSASVDEPSNTDSAAAVAEDALVNDGAGPCSVNGSVLPICSSLPFALQYNSVSCSDIGTLFQFSLPFPIESGGSYTLIFTLAGASGSANVYGLDSACQSPEFLGTLTFVGTQVTPLCVSPKGTFSMIGLPSGMVSDTPMSGAVTLCTGCACGGIDGGDQ